MDSLLDIMEYLEQQYRETGGGEEEEGHRGGSDHAEGELTEGPLPSPENPQEN